MQHMIREQRLLQLENVSNIRDLGGYETQEGNFTKANKYIRSSVLSKLNNADYKYIVDYGVKIILDLRTDFEKHHAPNCLKNDSYFQYYEIDLFKDLGEAKSMDDKYHDMGDFYIALLEQMKEQIYKVFHLFLVHPYECILFHCTSGKDRTGLISALLLDLAGCYEYDIVKDYSESFENNQTMYEELIKIIPKEDLLSQPLYMMKLLNHLYENYGSAQNYLLEIGFTSEEVEELKNNFIF